MRRPLLASLLVMLFAGVLVVAMTILGDRSAESIVDEDAGGSLAKRRLDSPDPLVLAGGNPSASLSPDAADGEHRLREEVLDLQRRLAVLERERPATETPLGESPSVAVRGAERAAVAAVLAEETKDLRQRLLARRVTPMEARRFWELLRSEREGGASASPRSLPGPTEEPPGESTSTLADITLPLDSTDDRWEHVNLISDGARGYAASFNDPKARIEAGACPISSTDPFTLRAWLRTVDGRFATALMARAGSQVGLSLIVGRLPGHVSFEAWSWESVRLTSRRRIDDGAWHEVEVSYDPATEGALLLVDGFREDVAVLGPGESLSATLRLGNNIEADQPFRGDVDEVSVLRRTTHADAFGSVR
jgi:hypothetical protein